MYKELDLVKNEDANSVIVDIDLVPLKKDILNSQRKLDNQCEKLEKLQI